MQTKRKRKSTKGVFKIGDTIKALKDIKFMIGCHVKGNIYKVTESNMNYFNTMHENYKLVKKSNYE